MPEWFTVVQVDEHTRPSDQYVCIYPDPPDVWTPWYYDISTLHGPTYYVYPQHSPRLKGCDLGSSIFQILHSDNWTTLVNK